MDQEKLLQKWLNDQLTETEKQAFEQLPDHNLNMKIIEAAKRFKAPDFPIDSKFKLLQYRLRNTHNKVRPMYFAWMYRVAAILVLALIAYFYIASNNVQIFTGNNDQKRVLLPDASLVILNQSSSLEYNSILWYFKRRIKMDGDAYFKVQKGSRFDVHTRHGVVSVIGTQFEVKSYMQLFEVKCFEGVVSVQTSQKNIILTHGEAVVARKDQIKKILMTQKQPQWLTNEIKYKSTPLAVVLHALKKHYGVKIVTKSVDTTKYYTGSLITDNLNLALEVITKAFGLKYYIDQTQKTVIISGQ